MYGNCQFLWAPKLRYPGLVFAHHTVQLIAHRRPIPCCDPDLMDWGVTLLLFQLRANHRHHINVRDPSEVLLQHMETHHSVK